MLYMYFSFRCLSSASLFQTKHWRFLHRFLILDESVSTFHEFSKKCLFLRTNIVKISFTLQRVFHCYSLWCIALTLLSFLACAISSCPLYKFLNSTPSVIFRLCTFAAKATVYSKLNEKGWLRDCIFSAISEELIWGYSIYRRVAAFAPATSPILNPEIFSVNCVKFAIDIRAVKLLMSTQVEMKLKSAFFYFDTRKSIRLHHNEHSQ